MFCTFCCLTLKFVLPQKGYKFDVILILCLIKSVQNDNFSWHSFYPLITARRKFSSSEVALKVSLKGLGINNYNADEQG